MISNCFSFGKFVCEDWCDVDRRGVVTVFVSIVMVDS